MSYKLAKALLIHIQGWIDLSLLSKQYSVFNLFKEVNSGYLTVKSRKDHKFVYVSLLLGLEIYINVEDDLISRS
jgi:hypothetical protein